MQTQGRRLRCFKLKRKTHPFGEAFEGSKQKSEYTEFSALQLHLIDAKGKQTLDSSRFNGAALLKMKRMVENHTYDVWSGLSQQQ